MRRLAILAVVLMAFASSASADPVAFTGSGVTAFTTYNFTMISGNYTPDPGVNLTLKVFDLGGGSVGFRFINNAPSTSTDFVGEVYFYDGALLNDGGAFVGSAPNTSFVSFNGDVTPQDLPGFNPPNNSTLHEFYAADSDGGNGTGIVPGGYADFRFTLKSGVTFSQMLGQFNSTPVSHDNPGSPDELYIGVHYKGLSGGSGGDSASFLVQQPGNPGGGNEGGGAPLPKTAWAGIGLLGMLAIGRTFHSRRRQTV